MNRLRLDKMKAWLDTEGVLDLRRPLDAVTRLGNLAPQEPLDERIKRLLADANPDKPLIVVIDSIAGDTTEKPHA